MTLPRTSPFAATLPVDTDSPHPASVFNRRQLLQIFAFWTLMALLTSANGLMDPRGRGLQPLLPAAPVALAFVQCYLWALVTPFVFWLCSRYTLERDNWMSRLLLHATIGVAVANVVSLVTDVVRFEVLYTPRIRPSGLPAFEPNIWMGVTRLWWLDDLIVFLAILAAGFARDYFLRYQMRRDEATQLQTQSAMLQAQLVQARLAALQSQLNPHFLFNTLNAVSALVERDPRGVRRMIARLSELLRYSLDEGSEAEVPLSRELAFLDRYLEIMQIRFQGKLEIVLHIDSDTMAALVPNLMLQTLVENALKYGITETDGGVRLEISATRVDERLRLCVRDHGRGLDVTMEADAPLPGTATTARSASNSLTDMPTGEFAVLDSGIGLRNARARLEQLYGDDQQLSVRAADGGGVQATVLLPFHTTDDMRTTGEWVRE